MKKPSPILVGLALGTLCASILAAAGEVETVHLRNGATIEGEVLQRTPERVVLDLGFTVLSIPVEAIDRVVAGEAEPAATAASTTVDLYRVSPGRPEQTVKENMERCAEAVVQIRTSIGLGSGFLIHPDGYVVTNHHVIAGERKLSVTLFEAGEHDLQRVQFENVRIVATNPHVDLALLKIDERGRAELPTVPLGDSAALRQGQAVFSIGSPLGLDRSVSQGIVSLRNRPLGGHIYIQSTAQINPGNSGGPLFNLRGEVIGINNMKIAAAGVEGLGFAIPANVLKNFLEDRDAFAFDTRSPNAGFRYNQPPASSATHEPVE